MCFDCLIRVDSHSADDGVQGRVLSAITKDEAMEFAPVGTYPSAGIDVLIVGTGFGGLTAALELTRKGHSVRILERNNGPDVSGKSKIIRSSSQNDIRQYRIRQVPFAAQSSEANNSRR
jgi:heterodisulfide reductase subunit A-like polyferredoxin